MLLRPTPPPAASRDSGAVSCRRGGGGGGGGRREGVAEAGVLDSTTFTSADFSSAIVLSFPASFLPMLVGPTLNQSATSVLAWLSASSPEHISSPAMMSLPVGLGFELALVLPLLLPASEWLLPHEKPSKSPHSELLSSHMSAQASRRTVILCAGERVTDMISETRNKRRDHGAEYEVAGKGPTMCPLAQSAKPQKTLMDGVVMQA